MAHALFRRNRRIFSRRKPSDGWLGWGMLAIAAVILGMIVVQVFVVFR